MSKRDPERPQWDDVLELRAQHPDLTAYAGNIVQLALQNANLVRDLKSLRTGAGRTADKIAVIRLGARVLEAILEKGEWVVGIVDAWAARQKYHGSENTLTMKMLPRALSRTGWLSKPQGPDPGRRMVATPAFISEAINDEDEAVWFNPQLLADWWEREPPNNKRIDPRVESAEALTQQARALGMGGKKGPSGPRRMFRFMTGEGSQVYWRVPPDLTQLLLERSRGDDDEEDHDAEREG